MAADMTLDRFGVWPGAPAARHAPPAIWTGCYVGGNVGGAWQSSDTVLSVVNDPTAGYFAPAAIPGVQASGTGRLAGGGFIGGVQAGCNYQTQNIVWGIESDFDWLKQNAAFGGTFSYTTDGHPYSLTVSDDPSWLYTLRGRIGWAVDRSLWYVTGGLAATKLNFQQAFAEGAFTPTPELTSDSTSVIGWTVGAGGEYALADNWSIRAEYLFAQFRDTAAGRLVNGLGAPPGCPGTFSCGATFSNAVTANLHVARVGLNYRFGVSSAKY
jgi:outer membrane immunogenic protein